MSSFSVPLAQLADKVRSDLETVARNATLRLFRQVAVRTPVDLGRFKANWNVSFEAPNVAVTASTNKARADKEAAKALTLPLGGVTYMSNGLPYAAVLEFGGYPNPVKKGSYDKKTGGYVIKSANGFSKQAPAGMIRLSAQEFDAYVRKTVQS